MVNQWFKFYGGEFLSDPKISNLSAQERSCWITLLCLASTSSTPGVIEFLTVETLLEKSGIRFNAYSTDEWDSALGVLEKFSRMKMITKNDDGTIKIMNWEKRQETALTNAERQARWRERNGKVTKPVISVTLDKNRIDKNKKEITPSVISSPSEVKEVKIDAEGNTKEPKKKDSTALRLREKLYDILERENGVRPIPNLGDYKQVQKALKYLKESDVIEMVEDAVSNKHISTVRSALTDRSIDVKREEVA